MVDDPLTNSVVDDSPTVRKILEVCLHRAGYEDVRTFSDGAEFLRWLLTPDARIPALVVVDLNLPTIDGYTLIRHLKSKPSFAQTVFVILTGRNGMLDKFKGRMLGVQTYLTKPFRTQDIMVAVTGHLEMARTVETAIGNDIRGEQSYARYL